MVPFPALQLPFVTFALMDAFDAIKILVTINLATGMKDRDGRSGVAPIVVPFARATVRTVLVARIVVVGSTESLAVGGDVGRE